jgi:hypothetical protein
MKVSRGLYFWVTIISLSLFLIADWWLLKMSFFLTAGILAVAYAANDEEE